MHRITELFWEVFHAILPLSVVVFILQATVLSLPADALARFLAGMAMVGAGLFLFLLGVEIGLLPIGELIGAFLPGKGKIWMPLFFGFLMGVVVTIAEPDVEFVPISFDAGGVTTGPMTVTFVMAIAVGCASVVEGRNPLLDGFGMISMVALAPILSVLVVGLFYQKRERKTGK